MTMTVQDVATKLNVTKEAATGLLRFLVETGTVTRLASVPTGKRGRQPAVFAVSESTMSVLHSFFKTVSSSSTTTRAVTTV